MQKQIIEKIAGSYTDKMFLKKDCSRDYLPDML